MRGLGLLRRRRDDKRRQAHFPAVQCWRFLQTFPQDPQCCGSVELFTSQPLLGSLSQSRKPALHVLMVHCPFTITPTPFATEHEAGAAWDTPAHSVNAPIINRQTTIALEKSGERRSAKAILRSIVASPFRPRERYTIACCTASLFKIGHLY